MFTNKGIYVQYAVTIAVNLSSLGSGAWLSWPSLVIKSLHEGDFGYKATDSEISTMVALYDLGNMITPLPSAYLTDKFGRKPIILASIPFLLAASVSAIVSTSIWYLYTARLLAGMAKGISYAVVPLFCAEIADVRVRGSLGTIATTMVGSGVSMTYVLGILLPIHYVEAIYILICGVLIIIGFFIPESPYFLVMKGKEQQAEQNLRKYRHYLQGDNRLTEEMDEVVKTVAEDKDKKTRFIDVIMSKSNRRALLIIVLTSTFQRTSGITPLIAYSTTILPESGGGASREVYVVIFSFILIVFHNIGMALVESWGRKTLMIVSTTSCAIITTIFAIFYHLRHNGIEITGYNWIPYTCLLLFGMFWGIGISIVPAILVGELFPMNVKSYASCIMSITYAGSNFVTNKAFGEIAYRYGNEVVFYFFSLSSLACTLFVIFFVFETKGKTFLEIQSKLKETAGEKE